MASDQTEISKESISLSQQVLMPTHQDLLDAKKYGISLLRLSPYAVYVKKISRKHKQSIMDAGQVPAMRSVLSSFATDFRYDFLVDFQTADGMALSDGDLDFMEKVQQVPELKQICMPEKSAKQTAGELETQIKKWQKNNPKKELIVVSEVYASEIVQKIEIAKRNGVKKYGIKFRSFRKNRELLSSCLATIRTLGLYSIVFGVMPRRWKSTNATMLLPAIHFQANAISRWIAWSGRATPMTLLCEDWTYKVESRASEGLVDYNGKNRRQVLEGSTQVSFNTAFDRIDTLNQASLMVRGQKPLTEIQFKGLFS